MQEARARAAGKKPTWNCDEWEAHTKKANEIFFDELSKIAVGVRIPSMRPPRKSILGRLRLGFFRP